MHSNSRGLHSKQKILYEKNCYHLWWEGNNNRFWVMKTMGHGFQKTHLLLRHSNNEVLIVLRWRSWDDRPIISECIFITYMDYHAKFIQACTWHDSQEFYKHTYLHTKRRYAAKARSSDLIQLALRLVE